MYPYPHGRMVTVYRETKDPRTGDVTTAAVGSHPQCAFVPQGSREIASLGVSVTESPIVVGPYGADIRSNDQLEVDGVRDPATGRLIRWPVSGAPSHFEFPRSGRQVCCLVTLQRVEGR